MSTEKEASQLATEPSQGPLHTHSQHPQLKDQQPHQADYQNEFLMPIKSSQPQSGFRAGNNGHRVNRAKTEPRNNPKEESKRKRDIVLPEIRANEAAQQLQRMKEKSTKLRELYEKKNRLYRRLQFINKKLVKAKMEMSYPYAEAAGLPAFGSTQQPLSPVHLLRGQSKSYSNSRNYNYLIDKHKKVSPESITSVTKNREVISFIQKMHEESLKRDLARHQRSQQLVSQQLTHVCLECTRAKCQADAVGSILRQSRQV